MTRHMIAALAASTTLLIPVAGAHAATPTAPAKRLTAAVTTGHDAKALDALHASRHSAAAANRAARRLAAAGRPAAAARAARTAALIYDANLDAYTALIDEAGPQLAQALAAALAPSLNGQAQAVALLEQLKPLLPAEAQAVIDQVIAQLAAAAPADAADLQTLAQSPLPVDVAPVVQSALGLAQSLLDLVGGLLGGVLPTS